MTDLDTETSAWREHLGYELIDEGKLSADYCAAWDTPADTERRFALLKPAGDSNTCMRFVETPEREGYWPPVTWGWNATEILVQDPDELAVQLEGSPFTRFGGPLNLTAHHKAPRVTQVYAPSGAILYLTRLLPGGSRYGLHGAKVPVDRVFNVVLGGPSLDELCEFYSNTLGLRIGEPLMFTGTLAAQASGAPHMPFPICVAPIKARNNILELDEYPENTTARPRETGELPGGMSMVSFSVASLDDYPVRFRAEPVALKGAPYNGARAAVIEGPAGEWLELIETSASAD